MKSFFSKSIVVLAISLGFILLGVLLVQQRYEYFGYGSTRVDRLTGTREYYCDRLQQWRDSMESCFLSVVEVPKQTVPPPVAQKIEEPCINAAQYRSESIAKGLVCEKIRSVCGRAINSDGAIKPWDMDGRSAEVCGSESWLIRPKPPNR